MYMIIYGSYITKNYSVLQLSMTRASVIGAPSSALGSFKYVQLVSL